MCNANWGGARQTNFCDKAGLGEIDIFWNFPLWKLIYFCYVFADSVIILSQPVSMEEETGY